MDYCNLALFPNWIWSSCQFFGGTTYGQHYTTIPDSGVYGIGQFIQRKIRFLYRMADWCTVLGMDFKYLPVMSRRRPFVEERLPLFMEFMYKFPKIAQNYI